MKQVFPLRMAVPVGPRPRSCVGPSNAEVCEITLLGPGPRDRPHAFGLVVFGIAHPRHAVAGLLADDPADFLEQALLVGGAQEGLVAVADRPQFAIRTTQCLLRPHAIIDVSTRAIPLDDLSSFVAERYVTDQQPPVLPVRPAHTRFTFHRLTTCHGRAPLLHELGNVVGVNCRLPAPAQPFLQGDAAELQPTPIDEIDRAVRPSAPDVSRDGVNHVPKLLPLPLELPDTELVGRPQQCQENGGAEGAEPIRLVVGRGDGEIEHSRPFRSTPRCCS